MQANSRLSNQQRPAARHRTGRISQRRRAGASVLTEQVILDCRLWRPISLVMVLLSTACIPAPELPPVTGPIPPGDVEVTATTETPTVFEQSAATVTATATGGTPPYLFRWDLNAGPEELDLEDVTSRSLDTGPMIVPGRYVFRVIATDSEGTHATGFVTIEVLSAVTATVPPLAVIDESVELTATVASDDVSLVWSITRGTAVIDNPTSTTATLTTSVGETVEVMLTATIPGTGMVDTTTTRTFEIVSVPSLSPRVLIETNHGDLTFELEGEAAELHTANFLLYVDEGFFDGLLFHRIVCTPVSEGEGECEGFVAQGGGFQRVDGEIVEKEPTREPVASEADNGLTNGEINSVALALTGGDPNSGTTQFFINVADNSFLDGSGFTVFARLVDGFEVLDTIMAVETEANPFAPPGEVSLPVDDVIMVSVSRVAPLGGATGRPASHLSVIQ